MEYKEPKEPCLGIEIDVNKYLDNFIKFIITVTDPETSDPLSLLYTHQL